MSGFGKQPGLGQIVQSSFQELEVLFAAGGGSGLFAIITEPCFRR